MDPATTGDAMLVPSKKPYELPGKVLYIFTPGALI
jgi:hypothetical protein